jgi:hypothetical protein
MRTKEGSPVEEREYNEERPYDTFSACHPRNSAPNTPSEALSSICLLDGGAYSGK